MILIPHEMPKMSGLDFLEKLRATDCDSGVIAVVSPDNIESGARALELGALDFLIDPVSLDQVEASRSCWTSGTVPTPMRKPQRV